MYDSSRNNRIKQKISFYSRLSQKSPPTKNLIMLLNDIYHVFYFTYIGIIPLYKNKSHCCLKIGVAFKWNKFYEIFSDRRQSQYWIGGSYTRFFFFLVSRKVICGTYKTSKHSLAFSPNFVIFFKSV